jgi:hypothetical protein
MERRLGLSRRVTPAHGQRVSEKRARGFAHHSCSAKGGGGRHRNTSLPLFHPGDAVPESGIYEVIHDGDHRVAHDAVMILGNQFPSCETCNERVRFRIVRTAPYIFQDEDFEEQE